MNKVIGLDISSSTVGWALFSYDENSCKLEEYGHIKPMKSAKGSLSVRAADYLDKITDFLSDKSPDSVAIEAYANKFSKGRSTARTIIVLSVFNEITSVGSIKSIGIEPDRYAVVTIRSVLSKIAGEKISSKEDAFDFIVNKFKSFKIRKKKTGTIKDECFDEADAVAVALTHIYKELDNGKGFNLQQIC
jgi:Holliday junction resolvasome RuvABC endonuclease subunit